MTDKRIKKISYVLAMEYYSAIKGIEILPFTETWLDLEIHTG